MNIKTKLAEILNNRQRNDKSLRYILSIIVLNNRIQYYKMYIMLALRYGYKVTTFIDFYHDRDSEVKHLVLRHDVDHNTIATRKLFEAELECGVRSTYYFRKSTIDRKLIQDMISAGFEVGFHYETLSDYAKEHNSMSIGHIDMKDVRERLKSDIEEFNQAIKNKIRSCAGHGDPMNIELKCSNNVLFEEIDSTYYGIEVEAYNKDLYENYIDAHIMDNSIAYNYGFSYQSNPISDILAGRRNIVFLAHPSHWYLSLKSRFKLLINILIFRNVVTETNRDFKRI